MIIDERSFEFPVWGFSAKFGDVSEQDGRKRHAKKIR